MSLRPALAVGDELKIQYGHVGAANDITMARLSVTRVA
jgi:hypothetical protein